MRGLAVDKPGLAYSEDYALDHFPPSRRVPPPLSNAAAIRTSEAANIVTLTLRLSMLVCRSMGPREGRDERHFDSNADRLSKS